MIFPLAANRFTGPLIAAFFFLVAWPVAVMAGTPLTGPTLHLGYGVEGQNGNSVSQFMYFVPLISAEQIMLFTNAGNTQCARVVSYNSRIKNNSFSVTCEFEFTGAGSQQDIFGHEIFFQRHEKELKAGKTMPHHLNSINVEGAGSGTVQIEGVITNGQRVVNEVQLRFNSHDQVSPVSINIVDVRYRNGAYLYENETVAKVNALTFRRTADHPKMEVTLGSIKRKDASDSAWQRFLGGIKEVAANLLLPPLNVEPEGQQAMMDFGLALASKKPDFTFPYAPRLKTAEAKP